MWDSSSYADGYFIDISKDSNFTKFVEGYNHKFYTDTNLTFNPPDCKDYYIRIRTDVYSCSGNSSEIFEIKREPEVFNLMGGGGFCSGENGISLQLSGSETNTLYYIWRNNTILENTVSGNGSYLYLGYYKNQGQL